MELKKEPKVEAKHPDESVVMCGGEYAPPTSVMNEWRKQCSCDERFRPCDGVMAGGFCDDMHDEDY